MPESETLERPAAGASAIEGQGLADAYLYLLGRALVVRQEVMDRGGEGFAFNRIKYNPLGTADFVNPNFDVAYLEAWIAVDPETPAIPADCGRIELHSGKAKLLGRVEIKGDPDGAVALQKAFALRSTGTPAIADPPTMPMFGNAGLIGVELFDHAEAILTSALDVSPIAAQMQQAVRATAQRVTGDAGARAAADKAIRETIVPEFKAFVFTRSAPYRNHWVGGAAIGNYGSDYRERAAINFAGIWANNIGEVTYFAATRDAEEQELNGSNSYVIHFPADDLPDAVVDAYWSVILVDATDYRVVPNDLRRYNFNNHSPLAKEADGSLRIAIGAAPVAGVPEINWLPAAAGKPFSLTFRAYVPRDAVKTGGWAPPAVTRVG